MKTTRIALCGVLVTAAAAHAQTAPQPTTPTPAPTPAPAPAPVETPPPVEAPPPPPPTVVEVRQEPKTVVVTSAPQDDGEIDERYRNAGLLFNLNNVFVQPGVLGGWQGFGLGIQKTLGSGNVARLGLELARATDPVNIVKTTRINGMDEVVSYDLQLPSSGFTARHAAAAVLDVLKPLTQRTIAPYLGAGVFAAYVNSRLAYTDDLTITDQVTEVDNNSNTLSVGLRGILGVGWRIGERFSLFAEYHLNVNVVQWQSDHTQTTTNNTASGIPASNRVETEFRETRWLNLDTALGQGGALGLVAHF